MVLQVFWADIKFLLSRLMCFMLDVFYHLMRFVCCAGFTIPLCKYFQHRANEGTGQKESQMSALVIIEQMTIFFANFVKI